MTSPVRLLPVHRLPLSSRDNLALRYEGWFPSSDTADTASDDSYPGSECGRWRNGRLADDCLSAGTEYCQLDCPFARKRALNMDDSEGFGSHNPEKESFDETGLSFFAGVMNAVAGTIIFGAVVCLIWALLS